VGLGWCARATRAKSGVGRSHTCTGGSTVFKEILAGGFLQRRPFAWTFQTGLSKRRRALGTSRKSDAAAALPRTLEVRIIPNTAAPPSHARRRAVPCVEPKLHLTQKPPPCQHCPCFEFGHRTDASVSCRSQRRSRRARLVRIRLPYRRSVPQPAPVPFRLLSRRPRRRQCLVLFRLHCRHPRLVPLQLPYRSDFCPVLTY
jgi:hypothetical protein